MIFTIREILEIIITILALGYIFSIFIKREKSYEDELFSNRFFDWEDIKYSAIITAPAIILHELGHKFVALGLGYQAIYHMSTFGLTIGIFLRLIGSGFLFFIPGYVSVSALTTPLEMSMIAFAGPLINLILFLTTTILLKYNLYPKYTRALLLTKQINLWLFILNMIPFPGFDGYKVFYGLFKLIGF